MLQALAALAGAALTVAACYGAGLLLLDRLGIGLHRGERFPLSFVTGAACLHLAVFAVLALKIAYKPVLIVLLLAAIGSAGIGSTGALWRRFPGLPPAKTAGAALLFLPFAVLAFFHAWAPESSPDGSTYHLGLVARYLRVRGFEPVLTHVFASLSGGVEMLFVPAFAIGRHSAAALVHFTFAVALARLMVAYGRRIGHPLAGVAAAFLTCASPVVLIDASSAYNDVAVAAVAFSVFYLLQMWDESRDTRLLVPAGLLAGYAYAIKYTAFVMVLFAVAFVLWRSRGGVRLRAGVRVCACAALMIAPWMIKNWIYVHNPVSPFGNRIFRTPNVHVSYEDAFRRIMRSYNGAGGSSLPLEVTVRGEKTSGVIGPVFLAVPLALLALRQRAGRRLLAAGAMLLAVYFTNIGTRFLIPCLPFFSLALALALAYSPPLLVVVMLFHALTSWPAGMRVYAKQAWGLDRILFREALRIVPEDVYLQSVSDAYNVARMIEANVPPGERVLSMEDVAIAYTSRDVLVSYLSASGDTLSDIFNAGWLESRQPSLLHTFRFPERAARRVRLLETAPGNASDQQWGVHELRFYDRGVELPRQPEWRLRAWPNPWDVQLAFDNSPATRWRTWEPAAAGMYVETDFGKSQMMDEVRAEICPEDSTIQTAIQIMDERGAWSPVSGPPLESALKLRRGIQRAAAYELHARGVNYFLIADYGYGAADIRDDPEAWGVQIAAAFRHRLYKVAW